MPWFFNDGPSLAEEDVAVKKEKHDDAVGIGTRRKKGGSRHRVKPRRTNTAVPKGSSRRTSTARLRQMMERHLSTLSQGTVATAASEGSGGTLVQGTRKKKGKRGKGRRGGTKLKGSVADREKAKLRAKRAKERRQRRRTEQQQQQRQPRRASGRGGLPALGGIMEEEEG